MKATPVTITTMTMLMTTARVNAIPMIMAMTAPMATFMSMNIFMPAAPVLPVSTTTPVERLISRA
jgi:hypothetical protein